MPSWKTSPNCSTCRWPRRSRAGPIASLLFLGPTGTGKTELAKAITEFLFEDETAMIRFDCSEFTGPEGKTRLIGMPTGYVGAEMGGQLTRPVMAKARRLILFDEIEKAHPSVFDLFLQLLGEGRLTEQGSGKTADFTQSIVILTSNAHADQIGKIQEDVKDYYEMVNAVKSYLADSKVFRPEILGRIDRIYVFRPLEGIVIAEIAMLKIVRLAKEYGLTVQFVAPELIMQTLASSAKVAGLGCASWSAWCSTCSPSRWPLPGQRRPARWSWPSGRTASCRLRCRRTSAATGT